MAGKRKRENPVAVSTACMFPTSGLEQTGGQTVIAADVEGSPDEGGEVCDGGGWSCA